MNIYKIKENLIKTGRVSFQESVLTEQIDMFERENNFILPDDYKEWLSISDGGEFHLNPSIKLFGILHNPIVFIKRNRNKNVDYAVIGLFSDGKCIACKNGGQEIFICRKNQDEELICDKTFLSFEAFFDNIKFY